MVLRYVPPIVPPLYFGFSFASFLFSPTKLLLFYDTFVSQCDNFTGDLQ